MRVVCQCVLQAKVEVEEKTAGQIERGLLVYLSVSKADSIKDAEFIAEKISNLRIFPDEAGKMNLSLHEVCGQVLLVSNFTLHGDCRKGRRPGFDDAAGPEMAEQLYESVAKFIVDKGLCVEKGIFGGYMKVSSINDGPVTFLLDSTRLF